MEYSVPVLQSEGLYRSQAGLYRSRFSDCFSMLLVKRAKFNTPFLFFSALERWLAALLPVLEDHCP